MPHLARGVSLTLFLLVFVPSVPDHGLRPAPNASHAQGLIRSLIARLRGETMPAGIVKANGLIEVAQVDVSSKYPGRLAEVSVKEGAKVAIGQAIARVSSPEADVTLVSPRSGEVEDLLAEAGEAVAAGEPIVTLVDLTDVYMTVFLPAAETAKLGMGDEARVILDAAPDYVIPAAVSFIASGAQISPKSVETKAERAKQTFRVDLRIDPQVLKMHHGKVEAGLRGAGFVRTKPDVNWPAELQIKLPPAPVAQEPSPAPAPVAQRQEPKPAPPSPVAQEPTPASAPKPAAEAPPRPAPAPAPVAEAPKPGSAPLPQAQEPVPAPAPSTAAEEPKPAPAHSPADRQAPTPAPTGKAQTPGPVSVAEAPAKSTPTEQELTAEFAPDSVTELIGAWAPSAQDCNRLFQRKGRALTYRQPVDQFAQAAIVERQRIRLPSATCQLDSAASDGGSLKLIAECADTISYTSRTVYVKLRSKDELVYSPTGDPVLATRLRKCPL
jgi:pyruvate/2-oxoglutarate dehydrogenase complex dihydrolipoamide acyltransferase (E2) component